jgi:excisionase family DNA binding protein
MHSPTSGRESDYLTSSQGARYLGISVRTLHRYEERGLITPHRLPGGHRRYLRSDLDALRAAA